MAHFAKVEDGLVTEVIVAEQDVIDSGLFGDPSLWVQTSYNTRLNQHIDRNSETPTGNTPLRGNFAGIGHIYDSENDVFYPPKPTEYPSWVIDATKWVWVPPLPYPGGADGDGKSYNWDEVNLSWVESPAETPPA